MTLVDPICSLGYEVDREEANEGWLMKGGNWVAKIRWNGEPLEAKQTATGKALAQAPTMLAALRGILENGSWHDDGTFVYVPPVPGTTAHIGVAQFAVDEAAHHIEEREVD